MEFLPVSTDRVTLRRLADRDLEDFQAYRLDPDAGRYQGWVPMADDEARSFLAEMNAAVAFVPGEWFQLGIADRASNRLIGDIGVCLSLDGTEAEIGFTLKPSLQGQGLAAEAVRRTLALVFACAAIRRVVATADARNHAALRLLSALGMQRLRSGRARFRGEPCVEHTFAIARLAGA